MEGTDKALPQHGRVGAVQDPEGRRVPAPIQQRPAPLPHRLSHLRCNLLQPLPPRLAQPPEHGPALVTEEASERRLKVRPCTWGF